MREAHIQSEFGSWLKTNWKSSAAFELKLVKGTSMPFSSVAEHQVSNLLTIKNTGLYHKISDSPIFTGMKSRFTKPKPMDCFFIKSPAYVVVCFYKPRQKKMLYLIDIDDFVSLRNTASRKSLTEEMADSASSMEIDLFL